MTCGPHAAAHPVHERRFTCRSDAELAVAVVAEAERSAHVLSETRMVGRAPDGDACDVSATRQVHQRPCHHDRQEHAIVGFLHVVLGEGESASEHRKQKRRNTINN